MTRRIIPDVVKDQDILTLPPTATVRQAAVAMAERRVGAVLIVERGKLAGIFTERDVLNRVLAVAVDPDQTPVSAVMTPRPATISPSATAIDALRLMQEGRYRHLPVVDGQRILGVVSLRDFFGAEFQSIEAEMDMRAAIMEGPGYGRSD